MGSSDVYRCGVPGEEELTPTQLVARVREKLRRKLGAVIDLTFTTRYYDSKVWQFMYVIHTMIGWGCVRIESVSCVKGYRDARA